MLTSLDRGPRRRRAVLHSRRVLDSRTVFTAQRIFYPRGDTRRRVCVHLQCDTRELRINPKADPAKSPGPTVRGMEHHRIER